MSTGLGTVTFRVPFKGEVRTLMLVTSPERAKAISNATRKINSERRVLKRALAKLSRTQRATVLKHLNIKSAHEEVWEAAMDIINQEEVVKACRT